MSCPRSTTGPPIISSPRPTPRPHRHTSVPPQQYRPPQHVVSPQQYRPPQYFVPQLTFRPPTHHVHPRPPVYAQPVRPTYQYVVGGAGVAGGYYYGNAPTNYVPVQPGYND